MPTITKYTLIALLITITATYAFGSTRVALVIGNSDYQSAPLKNPVNDATDVASKLQDFGFTVTTKLNTDLRTMETAIERFYKQLQLAEIGLFYYAGHGMQIDGANYLIPIKAKVTSPSDVKYQTLNAGRVLGKMQDAGNPLNIVILDACRDNPFRSYFRSRQQGLGFMDVPNGTIIAYSTGLNSLAADGIGRNGLYTAQLLKNMDKTELTVLDLFNETALDVKRITSGKQQPFIYFNGLEPLRLAGGASDIVVSDSSADISIGETGSLKVTSIPAGAEVSINGTNVGRTPLMFDRIHTGFMEVRIIKNSYKPQSVCP